MRYLLFLLSLLAALGVAYATPVTPTTRPGMRTVTADATINPADGVTYVDQTTGNVTLTLPSANSAAGAMLWIKMVSSEEPSNTITLQTTGGEFIEGPHIGVSSVSAASIRLAFLLISDGHYWWLLSTFHP